MMIYDNDDIEDNDHDNDHNNGLKLEGSNFL